MGMIKQIQGIEVAPQSNKSSLFSKEMNALFFTQGKISIKLIKVFDLNQDKMTSEAGCGFILTECLHAL